MKRCPQCNRVETDDELKFCRVDGTTLLAESGSIDAESGTERFAPPALSSEVGTSILPHRTDADIGRLTMPTSVLPSTPSPATGELSKPNRRKRSLAVAGVIIVVVAIALALVVYKFSAKKAAPFQSIKIEKLTNIGNATAAQISPNGEYVAHVLYENGKNSIRVWHVSTRSSVEIVPPTEDSLVVAAFSPDSSYIYYRSGGRTQPLAIYQIAVFGGTAKKLLERANSSGFILSPDGKQFAYVLDGPAQGENSIMLVNADGTGERALATRKGEERFGTYEPAWSPDGRVLAIGVHVGGTNMTLAAVSVEDGTVKLITSPKWPAVFRTEWLRDGSGLVFSAGAANLQVQIWYASYPAGEVRRITNDANGYGSGSVSLTADSSTLATIQFEYISNIFVAPADDVTRAKQITRGVSGLAGSYIVSWTPDGRLIYSGTTSGYADIWTMNADGTGSRQLTNDPAYDGLASASSDGRYVVFDSKRTGRGNIWRMDADGSNLKQLTTGGDDAAPSLSPDGNWVIYDATASGDLRKVSINGGDSVRLTESQVVWPTVSPKDGTIAGLSRSEPNSLARLAVFNAEGGAPAHVFDLPAGAFHHPQWSPDGRAVLYLINRASTSSLWSQSLDGGAPKQLFDFSPEQIFSFAVSRDGKQFAFARGTVVRDVVLITDTSKQ